MSRINLLPWREARRKELQAQFVTTLVTSVVLGAVVWGFVHFYHVQLIDFENARIAFVSDQIKSVDKKIEEIRQLEKEKQRLLSRMRAIEQLQGNRPLIVRLFDELVDSLPEGLTITKIKQTGEKITVDGVAESNARVSNFMRNLENSKWFKSPDLKIIQEAVVEDRMAVNNFTLTFLQAVPNNTQEKEGDES